MCNSQLTANPIALPPEPSCRTRPLADVIAQIVKDQDRLALREFHDHRRVFRYGAEGSLLLAEYVGRLCQSSRAREWCERDPVVLDQAYDLTIAKFSNLPDPSRKRVTKHAAGRKMNRDEVDCRYYFGAFCEHVRRSAERTRGSRIEGEIVAVRSLQTFVYRHFRLSCLESARRARLLVKRYNWKVNGTAMWLWFPTEMSGRKIADWLETNVGEPDPARPGERERVQDLVDGYFGRRVIQSIIDSDGVSEFIETSNATGRWSQPSGVSVDRLAAHVAEEKADNLSMQRLTIRSLHEERLRKLILTIFEGLSRGDYHDWRVAQAFGLSRATMSRFAGSRWSQRHKRNGDSTIPDLWRNTAYVLAKEPAFVSAAREAGVWPMVCAALKGRQVDHI